MKLAINLPATVEIDGADGSLLCPVCSATYIHQKAVTVFLRREDATTGFRVRIEGDEERAPVITVGSNLGGNPSLRRHGTAISFWCEMCGLTSTLAFAQHKGETFVSWQEIGRQPDNVRR